MSAILSADDLNDFISPGVACIKPVETLPKQDESNPYEVTTEDKAEAQNPAPASISLTDCLACSGCVTSAEAVLVSLQSHTEVLNTLDSFRSFDFFSLQSHADTSNGYPSPDSKVFIASVSPQVRASIAATYGISEEQAGNKIEQFLSGSQGLRIGGQHGSHFSYVFDTNRIREACLVLGAAEVADSATDRSTARPILTSACPGWVCYAEKTHPHVLPHMSKLKSPQALIGTLLKSVLGKAMHIHPSQIWHLAIMPCFDKKLEACREELTDKWWRNESSENELVSPVRDVDCVITSRELISLAEARGVQFSALPTSPLTTRDRPQFPDQRISNFLYPKPRRRTADQQQQQPDAGTSGGYLYHILKTTQARNPGSTISIQRGRNADVVEYTLFSAANKPIFKAARYYGFRNIQNLVRKLKPAKQSKLPGAARRAAGGAGATTDHAYVEVMACPGGCTNGGGQMRVEDVQAVLPETRGEAVVSLNARSQKEWLSRVDEAYFSADSDEDADADTDITDSDEANSTHTNEDKNSDTTMSNTDPNPDPDLDLDLINGISTRTVTDFLTYWVELVQIPLEKLAYTSFRKVESDVGKNKNLDDGQRIAAIAGLSGGGW